MKHHKNGTFQPQFSPYDFLDLLADRIAERLESRRGDTPAVNRLMTAEELAAYIRKSKTAIYHMVHLDQIPVKRIGRKVYFDRLEIDAWLDESV